MLASISSPSTGGCRAHYGTLLGAVGLAANGFLVLGKCLAGLATNSVALLADGLNNLSDMVSALITLVAFKLSAKSADARHPYGYGRMEYICGLIISLIILFTGFELLQTVWSRLWQPQPLSWAEWTIPFLLLAIVVKLLLAALGAYLNRQMASAAVKANITDSLLDACATGVILLATVAAPYTALPLDALLGLALIVVIFGSGLAACKNSLDLLLGTGPNTDLAAKIDAIVQSIDGLNHLHHLELHDYGPERLSATMHVTICPDADLPAAHALLEQLQRRLWEELHLRATIHLDLDETVCPTSGGDRQNV